MDHPRLSAVSGEDNVGLPDDLRCKRSDGKQWRCTAMSMPDKTVCEKHYIQAKRRAANSALRATLKKSKRKSPDQSDHLVENRSDFEMSPIDENDEDYSASLPAKVYMEKGATVSDHARYSPGKCERNSSIYSLSKPNGYSQMEDEIGDSMSYKTPLLSTDSSRSSSHRSFDASTMMEQSTGNTGSSEDTGWQPCHQCHKSCRNGIIWCLRCNSRGFCETCISKWYPNLPLGEIKEACPACRGTCICKSCLLRDNLVKSRIQQIPVLKKLQYLHYLLSSVLPVIKQIHLDQCSEIELEKKLSSPDIDVTRVQLNADEQMCCNICRIPITDYHRHCPKCSYDLCLRCCQDLRVASEISLGKEDMLQIEGHTRRIMHDLLENYPCWKASDGGRILCPPIHYGGCNSSPLNLWRIFKMNWVAKLVKNAEELVNGCLVNDLCLPPDSEVHDSMLCKCAQREGADDNFLYCPSSEYLKSSGIENFRMHWAKGKPVIVTHVFDIASMTSWDPVAIWRGIRETSAEKMKNQTRMIRAVDCLNWSEVNMELGEFIKGYSEGRIRADGSQEMLKLKDWPSPSSSEEFLFYQRPEYIPKLPLLEYIHPKFGFLNVAAKSPHYSLQNDVGPKIYISYGSYEELDRGDSVTNLHSKIHDMVYVVMHTYGIGVRGDQWNRSQIMVPRVFDEEEELGVLWSMKDNGSIFMENGPAVHWDVFRHEDVPQLNAYLRTCWKDFRLVGSNVGDELARFSFFYDGTIFLNRYHKKMLKEEFGVEPWSFGQYVGHAVFIPAGCPFQIKNLQSNVLLGLDFLSPESVGEAARLAEEIRHLPNDHEAKLQVMEVGKIALYAASSAIKEVKNMVLDPKLLDGQIGFQDVNLTAVVSQNLEEVRSRTKKMSGP